MKRVMRLMLLFGLNKAVGYGIVSWYVMFFGGGVVTSEKGHYSL